MSHCEENDGEDIGACDPFSREVELVCGEKWQQISEKKYNDFFVAVLELLDGKAMLNGVRGEEAIDRASLCRLLITVGDFALEHPEIEELDLNPVFAGPDGVIAVDWLALGTLLSDGA